MLLITQFLLIRLLKEDEEKGIEKILIRYRPDLIRFFKIKLSGNIEMAEELFQETALAFIKAIVYKKATFKEDGKIKNYVFTVAMNVFRNHYNKKCFNIKRERFFDSNDELNQCIYKIVEKTENPEEKLLKKNKKERVKNIINMVMLKISDSYRNVLKLKYTDNKSNDEIAELLNISKKAVESLYYRAKKAFYKNLKNIALKEDIYILGYKENGDG